MLTITINRAATNVSALNETLRDALGADYHGLSLYKTEVRVHLQADVSAEQVQRAEQLVKDHDPAVLTPKQQEEQAREQRLADFRAADALDLSAYDGATAEVQTLAQKIAWLELEIRELRGL